MESWWQKILAGQRSRKWPRRSIVWIILGATFLLTVGILAWRIRRQAKRLAKIRHQMSVLKAKERRTGAIRVAAASKSAVKAAEGRIEDLKRQQRHLEKKREEIVDERVAFRRQLDQVSSWEQLDELLDSAPAGPSDSSG